MSMPSRTSTSVVVSRSRTTPRIPRVARSTITTVTTRSRARRRTRRAQTGSNMAQSVADYAATIIDPFDHGPVRLGFGTMMPTGLGTAYLRTSVTTGSDGSFVFCLMPWVNTTSIANVGSICVGLGAGSTTWTYSNMTNATVFAAMAQEARIISGGIKVYPQVPLTSAPGTIFCGSIGPLSPAQLASYSINSLIGSPYLKIGYGNVGAMATIRPMDPQSYEFSTVNFSNMSVNSVPNMSPALIAGTGFPASTVVTVEFVLNFEYLLLTVPSGLNVALSSMFEGSEEIDTLPQQFSNIESLWSSIRRIVGDSGIVESVTNIAATSADAALRAGAGTLLSTRSTGSSGRGRLKAAAARALAAGSASALSTMYRNLFGSAAVDNRAAGLLMP